MNLGPCYLPGGDEGIFGWGYYNGGLGFRNTKGLYLFIHYQKKWVWFGGSYVTAMDFGPP